MKTHLNLPTVDLDKSIAFYRTLLKSEPAKHLSDYALFITEDPGLELALDLNSDVKPSHGTHFGVVVDSIEAVDSAIERLQAAGIETLVEREETCCYANQTKVWATDPDGRRWEVYTVHEETDERDDEGTTCCASDTEKSCCVASRHPSLSI
jgi:catechol 2,3-dioxygenase-like lactoylglutathione lyase family enzyme